MGDGKRGEMEVVEKTSEKTPTLEPPGPDETANNPTK